MNSILKLILYCHFSVLVRAFYQGPFQNERWEVNTNSSGVVDKSLEISILIGLQVHNTNELERLLSEVSNPISPNYGKYLTASEIAAISSTDENDLDALLSWLDNANGDVIINHTKDMISLKAPIISLEQLFSTNLEWFKNVDEKVTVQQYIRATQNLIVPDGFQNSISFVSINAPIITKQGAQTSTSNEEDIYKSTHIEESPDIATETSPSPANGLLSVQGGQNAAVVTFSFQCWAEDGSASNVCTQNTVPSSVLVEVIDFENSFPSVQYQVPFDSLKCLISGEEGEIPCNPLNGTAFGCTCGLLVGPLPKYAKLSFTLSTIGDFSDKMVVASSPGPVTLLDLVTPSLLRDLYNIPEIHIKNGATLAVAEFGTDQFYRNADLDEFFSLTGISKENIPDSKVFGNLKNDQTVPPGSEAMLDVEVLMAISPNSSLSYYTIGDCSPFCESEDFLLWLFSVGLQEAPEMVHSISYADSEAADHNTTAPGSVDFFNRIDTEFIKLGLRGVTLVFASGDNGVCSFPSPSNSHGCSTAQPTWPASSPFVTAVGSTQLSDKYLPACGSKWSETFGMSLQCTGVGEIVCQSDKGGIITPGGGFSNINARPWWQEKAVSKFLQSSEGAYPSQEGFFNKNGRGFPDLAVHGALYLTIVDGDYVLNSGTSASTPLVAAMINIVNDMRIGEGLPPLGFINPLLYHLKEKHPKVFNDITVGNNACRAGHMGVEKQIDCNDKYFAAAPGWDPVSGLGSINFELFSEVVLEIGKDQKSSTILGLDDFVIEQDTPHGIKRIETIDPFNFVPLLVAFVALGMSIHANLVAKKSSRNTQQSSTTTRAKGLWRSLASRQRGINNNNPVGFYSSINHGQAPRRNSQLDI